MTPQQEIREMFMLRRVGIIGHRGWIAQSLARELACTHIVHLYDKDLVRYAVACNDVDATMDYGLDEVPMSELDCVFLFAGTSNPNPSDEERMKEQGLILDVLQSDALNIVYISSQAAGMKMKTLYGHHKHSCETLISTNRDEHAYQTWTVIRPAAVFGAGQSIDSHMLVPSLARGDTNLRTPDEPTKFIHVDRLVDFLYGFACGDDQDGDGQPDSSKDIPGTFSITPRQMLALHSTFEHYRSFELQQ